MALRIDEWRRLRNISQAELAEKCGVSRATINAWEKNPDLIRLGYLTIIEKTLGIHRDDIIFMPSESKKG